MTAGRANLVLPTFNYAFLITYANPISQAQRTIDAKSHDAGSAISSGMVCQGINQSTAWIAKTARLACPQNTSDRSKDPKTGTSFNFSNAIETQHTQ